MSVENSLGSISDEKEIDSSSFIDDSVNKSKVFFWEKWAFKGDGADDKLNSYELEDDPKIREVIKNFESRIIGNKMLFSEIEPKNPSVKNWIEKIRCDYPKQEKDIVEYLLDTFRSNLRTASKEKYKYIVGILLLHDVMLIIHSKKESSLAELKNELKDEMRPVDIVLHPKNVLRTAIIKYENGKSIFSVFENSRILRKGHADFWGIEPEDVSWDSLGNIFLTIELSNFMYPIQLPMDSDQLDEMIENKKISPRGKIRIGKEEGAITKVEIFKRYMDFNEFYDFYITEKEKLEEYQRKFKKILKTTLDDFEEYTESEKYKYKENIGKIFEITPEKESFMLEKKHPRYNICFFTKVYPRILPSEKFVNMLYESIFYNNKLEIWHAGEETSHEPITIGSLSIYNKIEVNRDIIEFSDKLLSIIQDSQSKKERLFLQEHFCTFWKHNIYNKHLKSLFDFMIDFIISKDLEYEYGNEGIIAKEIHLEFKSADDVSGKPSRFAETICETVKGYIGEEGPKRLCILYGIEDNGEILPLYNKLKNDMAPIIEEKANEMLKAEKV